MAKDSSGRLHVTVKSKGKRKLSSKLWLERQLNDPYVAQARRDGFRSRAAYKLTEIDDKFHLLKQGMTVVDLGAAPGGWSQVAAKRVGAPARGKVVAIDLLEMGEIPGVDFAQLDFLADDAPGWSHALKTSRPGRSGARWYANPRRLPHVPPPTVAGNQKSRWDTAIEHAVWPRPGAQTRARDWKLPGGIGHG